MNSAQAVSDYQRDGCIRVHGFFDAASLADVRGQLGRYGRDIVPALPTGDRTLEADGATVRNLWRMEQHDPFFANLAQQTAANGLLAELLRGEPVLMGVETFNKPARVGSGVPPHQDNAYFCQAPPDVLTIWIAIDAATEANGPIIYLKGSHGGMHSHRPSGVAGNSMGLAKMPPHDDADLFRGTLEPGDALVHHCQTIHWSGPNNTDKPRCGLLMVFRAAHTREDAALKSAYDLARAAKPVAS